MSIDRHGNCFFVSFITIPLTKCILSVFNAFANCSYEEKKNFLLFDSSEASLNQIFSYRKVIVNLPGCNDSQISLNFSSTPFIVKWVKNSCFPISDHAVGFVQILVPILLMRNPSFWMMNMILLETRANVAIISVNKNYHQNSCDL